MSSIALERVVKPVVEPVSVDEVRLYTKITGTVEDAILAKWIKSARIKAENYMRQSFVTQQWELTLDTWPGYKAIIHLPRPPLRRLVSFTAYDTLGDAHVYDLDNFLVDKATSTIRLVEDVTWYDDEEVWDDSIDITLDKIKIRYETGYGTPVFATTTGTTTGTTAAPTTTNEDTIIDQDIPEYVADAIYLYVAYRNENRLGETDTIPRVFYMILDEERRFRGLL